MSKLSLYGRPWVIFNPKDKNHRKWYAEFVRTGSWGHCPVRFVVEHGVDLITMVQRMLIKYYVDREFRMAQPKTVAKKPRKTRLRKVVDNEKT